MSRPALALSNTTPLRREIEAALLERPFAIRFWDGTIVHATDPEGPTFEFRSPEALAHVIRAPGELGLGRAYVLGLIDVDDIEQALQIVDTFQAPKLSPGQIARLGVAVIRACGLVRPPRRPASELKLTGERHSLGRDRNAVRYHYDAGNEFFALFLDPSMTYSCAYFKAGASTLEAAQRAKLDLVATKLALRTDERVLDVGCGWGSFAIHAAQHYGVKVLGVTLSEQQVKLGRERVQRPGSRIWCSCDSRITASSPARSSTQSPASAWWSTWGRSGSTSTWTPSTACSALADGCSTTGSPS